MHCVFCGAKQPAVPAPAPPAATGNPNARTVLGYSAQDLMKQAPGRPGTPQPVAAPPPAAGPQGGAVAHAATMFAGPQAQPFSPPTPPTQPSAHPPHPPQSFAPPGPAGYPPGPATVPPPSAFGPPQGGQFGGSAATAETVFMQQSPAVPQAGPAGGGYPQPPGQPYPNPNPGGYPMPASPASQAATFVANGGGPAYPPGPPPGAQYPQAQAQPYAPPAGGMGPFQVHGPGSPYQGAPGMAGYNPVPVSHGHGAPAQPPYLASQTAARMGRPVEPFADRLRVVLLAFGVLLLAAFCTPLTTDPMGFHWNVIADSAGKAKIDPLLLGAVGLLGLAMALLPLAYAGRAAMAAVLGAVPMILGVALAGSFHWQELVSVFGTLALVSGLLVRSEYRGAMLPRILVTIGVVLTLVPWLIPEGGTLPLVGLFKMIGDAPGKAKVAAVLQVVPILLAVIALVAWIPAPSSAGASAIAWLILLWPLVAHGIALVVAGDLGATIKASPFTALMAWAKPVGYAAFGGFGLAALFGKQLESQ